MPTPLEMLAAAGLSSPEAVQRALQADRERKAMLGIAKLREAGIPDDVWRRMGTDAVIAYGDPTASAERLAGGYGLVGPAVQAAGIASQYKIGRADLRRSVENDKFDRSMQLAQLGARPYNTVAYIDAVARAGGRMPINNPILQNIKPQVIDAPGDLGSVLDGLEDEPKAFGNGGSMMLQEPIVGIPQRQLMPGQEAQFIAGEAGAERVDFTPAAPKNRLGKKPREFAMGGSVTVNARGRVTSANPYGKEIKGLTGGIGLGRKAKARAAANGGVLDVKPGSGVDIAQKLRTGTKIRLGGAGRRRAAGTGGSGGDLTKPRTPTTDTARNDTGLPGTGTPGRDNTVRTPQMAAMQLLGQRTQAIRGMDPRMQQALDAGQVPGLPLINPYQFNHLMDRDSRARLLDGWLSSGAVADEASLMELIERMRPAGL